MFCQFCGQELPNDAEVCLSCGKPIPMVNSGQPTGEQLQVEAGKPRAARKNTVEIKIDPSRIVRLTEEEIRENVISVALDPTKCQYCGFVDGQHSPDCIHITKESRSAPAERKSPHPFVIVGFILLSILALVAEGRGWWGVLLLYVVVWLLLAWWESRGS